MMIERNLPVTPYRGFYIAIQPTGQAADALKDSYAIFGSGAHAMSIRTLFEYLGSKTKYDSEQAARDSAMSLAEAWIDKRLE
jgi:hypothetical protein